MILLIHSILLPVPQYIYIVNFVVSPLSNSFKTIIGEQSIKFKKLIKEVKPIFCFPIVLTLTTRGGRFANGVI